MAHEIQVRSFGVHAFQFQLLRQRTL